jgi:hypothetical protein
MNNKEIKEKIIALENELQLFQAEKQKEIDKFMFESGLTNFMNDVMVRVSKMQGKIEAFKELLIDEKEEG